MLTIYNYKNLSSRFYFLTVDQMVDLFCRRGQPVLFDANKTPGAGHLPIFLNYVANGTREYMPIWNRNPYCEQTTAWIGIPLDCCVA
jgi:hypothetical protein